MRIYSWNVNGIRSVWNKGLFQKFIAEHTPDILCLQETKAMREDSPITRIDLPEYTEYWHSAVKKGYSGTAIFTKKEPLDAIYGFVPEVQKSYLFTDQYGDPTQEGRVISVEYTDFYLVTVYTPNSKGDLSRLALRATVWDAAFLTHCQHLEKKKPVLFCGDLNVAHTEDDLARPGDNEGKHGFTREERAGFERFIQAGYADTFRLFMKGNGHYTWWSHFGLARERNVGWRIDYFFASRALVPHIKKSSILPDVIGSDHCPILLELK
jgi:exodeoxyribonuclease-3